jgi:uncharacterized protein YbcI
MEHPRVFHHVGFFVALPDAMPPPGFWRSSPGSPRFFPGRDDMNDSDSRITQQLARVAGILQQERTGLAPRSVTATLGQDTLVVTMHDALTPAEKALARTPEGAARVQEFHRQLFGTSTESMRREIKRITGREVRKATAEFEPVSGAVVHTFPTGAMVQVYLLSTDAPDAASGDDHDTIERADDDGLHPAADQGDSG